MTSFLRSGRVLEHELYREAQSHMQQAEWEEALRCVRELRQAFPDSPEVQSLEREILLRARAAQLRPRRRLANLLPWRRVVFTFLLTLAVLSAAVIGVVAYQGQIAPRLEENRRLVRIETNVRQGQFALARGQYAEAVGYFEAALALAPDDVRAQQGLGEAQEGQELEAWYQRAVDLIRAERWDEAYSTLMALEEMKPGYRDVPELMKEVARELDVAQAFMAGEQAFQAGDWRDAISHYELVRSLDGTYEGKTVTDHLFYSYLQVARDLASQIGTNDAAAGEALRYFNKALALRPKDPQAQAGRQEMETYLSAVTLVQQENWEEAIPLLEALRAIRPDYANGQVAGRLFLAYMVTADEAAQARNWAQAQERYELLLELAQKSEEADLRPLYDRHMAAAEEAARADDYKLATFYYSQGVQVARAMGLENYTLAVDALERMAEASLEHKDTESAARYYREAVMLTVEALQTRYETEVDKGVAEGDKAAEQQDFEAAIAHYKAALAAVLRQAEAVSRSQTASQAPAEVESKPGTLVYTVVPGDTVSKLAIRFNTTVEEIVALNNLEDPSLIEVGQQLIIPATAVAER